MKLVHRNLNESNFEWKGLHSSANAPSGPNTGGLQCSPLAGADFSCLVITMVTNENYCFFPFVNYEFLVIIFAGKLSARRNQIPRIQLEP